MQKEESPPTLAETIELGVEAAEEAVKRPGVRKLARFGFYAKGVLFIVIGALGVLLALGSPEGKIADPTGALTTIASRRFGTVLLILFIVGAIGHGVWNILRAVADVDDAGKNWLGIFKRAIAVGIGIFYLGLALTAIEIILASRVTQGSSQAEETFVSILLAIPLIGTGLLFLIGLGVVGAGFHECYSGVSGKFKESYRLWGVSGPHHLFITILGILSFTARALLLVMLGYFFLSAAVGMSTNGQIGLDAALTTLAQSTYGKLLLFFTASGLFAHGVLAFYEAKYRRIC